MYLTIKIEEVSKMGINLVGLFNARSKAFISSGVFVKLALFDLIWRADESQARLQEFEDKNAIDRASTFLQSILWGIFQMWLSCWVSATLHHREICVTCVNYDKDQRPETMHTI